MTNRLKSASGSMTFQPRDISWSKRKRGRRPADPEEEEQEERGLREEGDQLHEPGRLRPEKGTSEPPRKKVTVRQAMTIMAQYSPRKNRANFIEEYSVWKPPTSSGSHSAKSKGWRFVSAKVAIDEEQEGERLADQTFQLPERSAWSARRCRAGRGSLIDTDREDAEDQRELVADHLRRGAQAAEQRVLRVARASRPGSRRRSPGLRSRRRTARRCRGRRSRASSRRRRS